MDLGSVVPGLTVQPTPLASPVYTLRGVGFYETTLSASPTVAVYVDEVVIPFSAETRGIAFDVQRVEVLKGPQGTLFGANTTGGAINYIANKPTDQFAGGLDASFARFGTAELSGFLNIPVSDTLKMRFAGRLVHGDPLPTPRMIDRVVGSKVIAFHTVPPPPYFHQSPAQLFAAIFIAAFSKPSAGFPGTVWKRHSCLPVAAS